MFLFPLAATSAEHSNRISGFSLIVVGILFLLFLIAIIILLVVFLSKSNSNKQANARYDELDRPPIPTASPDALRILDERYARGEISPEQYHMMKQDILSHGQ